LKVYAIYLCIIRTRSVTQKTESLNYYLQQQKILGSTNFKKAKD